MRSLVSLSGGMDSATLLANSINAYGKPNVEAVGFTYGSKHNSYENKAAEALALYYEVPYRLIDLTQVMAGLKSNLLKAGGEIPEGHYEQDNMSLTVVPGRNIIFLSVLASIAMSEKFNYVTIGVHAGDHHIYPDCRPEFIRQMGWAIFYGTDSKVQLLTPLLHFTKAGILEAGLKMMVPYHITRTCYKDQPVACGKCGSCVERREAFSLQKATDPIPYEYDGPLPAKE